jgi:molecular chaperone GrpE
MMDNDHKTDAAAEATAPVTGTSGPTPSDPPFPEDSALADEEHQHLAARLADLEAQVTALEAEKELSRERWVRAAAETENVRRRAEQERESTAKYAISRFASALLDVADNLRRAIEAVPAEARASVPQVASLLDGVEATERQLLAAFEQSAVRRIDPLGQAFDPNLHQAMFEIPGSGKPSGTIVQVLQPGYLIHDRLLRPALVGVAKGGAAGGDPGTKAEAAS